MLSCNIINYLINKNLWTMIVILTLVYWSLYKILKEYLWNIFTFLKIYFLGVNVNYKKLEVLLQVYVFTVQFKSENENGNHVNV